MQSTKQSPTPHLKVRLRGENKMLCVNLGLYVVACLTVVVGISAQSRTLVITSHESLSLVYVDEVEQPLPNANLKNATDSVPIPGEARLIAVQAVSTVDVCAGFIGSVTNDYLVTDGSWKCSEYGAEKWFEFGFDDSSWKNAYVVGRNGNVSDCPDLVERIPDISWKAYWIWTQQETATVIPRSDGDLMTDKAVFCRGYLPLCETYLPCVNGGTCLQNSDILCACPPEWAGRYCEKVWTPCANEPCLNNGTCIITSETTYQCSCHIIYTGVNCETKITSRNLTITVKSTLYDLYIDGEKQTDLVNQNNWTLTDEIIISPTNRLIGVMAIDSTATCAGVIGSVTGDYLVTDSINWRCSHIPDIDWYELGWNDTYWPLAYSIGENANVTLPEECRTTLSEIPSISPNAYWIWTDTINVPPQYHQTIYCRGYLPMCELNSPCYNGGTCNKNNKTLCTCLVGFTGQFCETVDLKNASMTAKATLYAAYVDGNPINLKNGTDWQKTDNLRVNTTSRLLALMAIQLEGPCPGILASVVDSSGDYVLTSTSWKCSSTALVGWAELGYNDSSWQPARLIRKNEYTNDTTCQNELTEIPSISSDAYWIWTNNPSGQDVVAFCRGYLPICSVSPCKNGGTCNGNKALMCTCLANYTGRYCENEIVYNTTVSRHDAHPVKSDQILDEIVHIQRANPIPHPLPVPPPAPTQSSTPTEKSGESDRHNLLKDLGKDRMKVTG